MERPYLRLPIAAGAFDWITEVTGSGITGREFLAGGISHSNYLFTLADGDSVVLRRWVRPGWQDDDPDYDVAREAAALRLLKQAGVSAPRLIAVDPAGQHCGVPALLMTRLPGKQPGRHRGPDALRQLAEAAAALHRIPGPWDGIPAFAAYNDLSDPRPAAHSTRGHLWERAFEVVSRPGPAGPARFIHRDYHHNNTLWTGRRMTGIVDWTTASVGPVGVDVGHMRWNLVVDWGVPAADEFTRLYRAIGEFDDDPYWHIRCLVDLLPDDDLTGRDLDALEPYLERLLALVR
jgi:aminoglycoside phosphotransferase (APT) family kinase protein